jgi:hypothetical protein
MKWGCPCLSTKKWVTSYLQELAAITFVPTRLPAAFLCFQIFWNRLSNKWPTTQSLLIYYKVWPLSTTVQDIFNILLRTLVKLNSAFDNFQFDHQHCSRWFNYMHNFINQNHLNSLTRINLKHLSIQLVIFPQKLNSEIINFNKNDYMQGSRHNIFGIPV